MISKNLIPSLQSKVVKILNIIIYKIEINKFYLGQGSYPRLSFDRREILLPPTPLNIES
jgi:hypothetical protein